MGGSLLKGLEEFIVRSSLEIIAIIVTVAIYRYPRLWFIERELPDVI